MVIDGADGPGKGKHVVLIAADDEYRSEELIPQLAKILALRQGFTCTVLFAVDPEGKVNPGTKDNIPGLEALKTADLLVFFARFRELPDDQMKLFVDYLDSGKPLVSLRTSTHAFNYTQHKDSPYARYSYNSKSPAGGFGREVVGETWVNHYGKHQKESTRGVIAPGMEKHPIVKGADDIWGPSDVYALNSLTGDSQPIVLGQVLSGMNPTDPPTPGKDLVPVAWTKTYTGPSGKPARDLHHHDGTRRRPQERRLPPPPGQRLLLVPGHGKPDPRRANVDLVGMTSPTAIGTRGHRKGLTPEQAVHSEGSSSPANVRPAGLTTSRSRGLDPIARQVAAPTSRDVRASTPLERQGEVVETNLLGLLALSPRGGVPASPRRLRHHLVVDILARTPGFDDAGDSQQRKMVAHRRLSLAEPIADLGDVQFALLSQVDQDVQPGFIAEKCEIFSASLSTLSYRTSVGP